MEKFTYLLFAAWLAFMAPAVAGRVSPIRFEQVASKKGKRQ